MKDRCQALASTIFCLQADPHFASSSCLCFHVFDTDASFFSCYVHNFDSPADLATYEYIPSTLDIAWTHWTDHLVLAPSPPCCCWFWSLCRTCLTSTLLLSVLPILLEQYCCVEIDCLSSKQQLILLPSLHLLHP